MEETNQKPIRNIVDNFIKEVRPLFGDYPTKAILYGSYARGDYNCSSDVDLMILTQMEEKDIVNIEDDVIDTAYEYELRDGVIISINIKNINHFEYWKETVPYYRNVAKEGVVVG